ncbi:cytochrome P450 oxidoreductase [Lecanosticta acicola]|uniref:Cytochrome P450 oxidoreductase n=1 Tax=Lecanosticta acicola TaxID=111012 RepID=A0AAI8YW00_9PEZI|nr:cytochrome P450 oxidoreductase [Lecanosticta acicola]
MARNGELEPNEDKARYDTLSTWAAVKSQDPDDMLTRDFVVALRTTVVAGSDTTAIAIRAILYYLMENPDKMRKLQEEIDTADRAGRLSAVVSDKEARALRYLTAIEKEAIRLCPSVGLIFERHVPAGAAAICGRYILGGISPWILHYSEEVFPVDRRLSRTACYDTEAFLQCRSREPEVHWSEYQFDRDAEMDSSDVEGIRCYSNADWKAKNVWFTQQKCEIGRRKS